jgi:AraC family transcriptional regulator of adaptative response / DNA-3-methyladenine glycosylase II
MELNHDVCYRALTTRDARFDGVFFVGVTTTRIYCRPVCTARTAAAVNCRFFASAAAAEQARFRPCLRCRPELAPGHSPVDAVGRVARGAARRIEAGALNNGRSVEDLAGEFGLCSRQLRRSMRHELGVSPVQLAQTHRLLLAKQLLTETRLPIIEVALASGFESVRRFNALFKSHYRLEPRRFRKSLIAPVHEEPLRLRLSYRPPFAWRELLRFLADRAVEGTERVSGDCYARTVSIGSHRGWLSVALGKAPNTLLVEFSASLTGVLAPMLARLRHLFDLGARPDVIASHLGDEPRIGPAVKRCPGLRVPGTFSGFDLAWRAILGQRISVRAATVLAGRVATEFGEPIETPDAQLNRLAPEPERLATADAGAIERLGISRAAAQTIRALATAVALDRLRLEPGVDAAATIEQLEGIPGVGRWTAEYIAMRALGWPDAFPEGDLGLRRGLGGLSHADLRTIAEDWRPWRAYAVMHVWNGLVGSQIAQGPLAIKPRRRKPRASGSNGRARKLARTP